MSVSIRTCLGTILLTFSLLVAGSVAATFLGLRAQAADATVINLAGRQRMLLQQIDKAILSTLKDPQDAGHRAEMGQPAAAFDLTLGALLEGGPVPYDGRTVILPATNDAATRAQLERVAAQWEGLQEELGKLETNDPSSTFHQAARRAEALVADLLPDMDRTVQLYEAVAEAKVNRLYLIQAVFFTSAVFLLIAGSILTQWTIVRPISALQVAAGRIAGGDLQSPLHTTAASKEVRILADSFEKMRHALAASLDALKRSAGELETRVQRRTGQLNALLEVNAEIASNLEIQQVLDLVVEKSRRLTGAEVAVLALYDPAGQSWSAAAISGPAEAATPLPKGIADSLTLGSAGDWTGAGWHDGNNCTVLRPPFRRSHLALPLRAGERTLGMLCVGHRQSGRFGEDEERMLAMLTHAGAIALENARLYAQAQEAAALAERERLVADIHDSLAQTLGFLDLRLGVVGNLIEREQFSDLSEHLALIRRTVEQAGQEVRRLLAGLHEGGHLPVTLEQQLRQVVEHFQEEGLTIDFHVPSTFPAGIPAEGHEHVVLILQEALTNVRKHAPGSRVVVTVETGDGEARLRVQDDGPGFEPDARTEKHFGLAVMKTRAAWLGGDLRIESAPGWGTAITLHWPLEGRGKFP